MAVHVVRFPVRGQMLAAHRGGELDLGTGRAVVYQPPAEGVLTTAIAGASRPSWGWPMARSSRGRPWRRLWYANDLGDLSGNGPPGLGNQPAEQLRRGPTSRLRQRLSPCRIESVAILSTRQILALG
jgi:hypothetical protein